MFGPNRGEPPAWVTSKMRFILIEFIIAKCSKFDNGFEALALPIPDGEPVTVVRL